MPLVGLLGKLIDESSALCIPTATYANPGGAARAWSVIAGREAGTLMCELGWKSLGVSCATGGGSPGWRTSRRPCLTWST